MIVLVTYDLRRPGQNYQALYDLLKSVPNDRPLESVWLLRTTQPVEVWSDKIRALIDANDRLFVVDITNAPRQGWLSQASWNWINAQLV